MNNSPDKYQLQFASACAHAFEAIYNVTAKIIVENGKIYIALKGNNEKANNDMR